MPAWDRAIPENTAIWVASQTEGGCRHHEMDEMLAVLSVETLQAIQAELPSEPCFAIWQAKFKQAMQMLTVQMPVGWRRRR